MLLGRPVMIHDCDAYSVELPADLDDHFITPLSLISVDNSPSKTSFYIASCKLYRILGDILREFSSASDEYRSMAEETWLCKVSSMMRFDKRLKDWLESLPKYLNWEFDYDMPLSDDIVRQRNVLQVRYRRKCTELIKVIECTKFIVQAKYISPLPHRVLCTARQIRYFNDIDLRIIMCFIS